MLLLYFYLLFLVYLAFIALMIYGWHAAPLLQGKHSPASGETVSLVVAIRNEEKNIAAFLRCLADQSLHGLKLEIIIVDDGSEDGTLMKIQQFLDQQARSVTIISRSHEEGGSSPKKAALNQGINQASGSIIILTDGDCRMGKNWILTMSRAFADIELQYASGPVMISEKPGFHSAMQSLEFCSLMGAGGAMLNLKYPLLCNGANIAFRKGAFIAVNGYEGIDGSASGDDVYMMQKMWRKYGASGVKFVKDYDAIVSTDPITGLSEFMNQRTRWASKWNNPLLPFSWVLPVFLFAFYGSFSLGLVIFFQSSIILHLAGMLFVKIILDILFLRKVTRFCHMKSSIWVYLLCELVYPLYALIIGFRVHFYKWHWKGRTFKK